MEMTSGWGNVEVVDDARKNSFQGLVETKGWLKWVHKKRPGTIEKRPGQERERSSWDKVESVKRFWWDRDVLCFGFALDNMLNIWEKGIKSFRKASLTKNEVLEEKESGKWNSHREQGEGRKKWSKKEKKIPSKQVHWWE